MLKQSVMAG